MKILIFGAGRSAYYTIQYLLSEASRKGWEITVADSSEKNLEGSTAAFPAARTVVADVADSASRKALTASQDIIISLLPAQFHAVIAQDCLENDTHLITPSYTSPQLEAMGPEAEKKGLIFLNELGLDPGIDHMSAMQAINELKSQGARISSFRSYCGGLMALGSENNPWRYKLSWNPYNVVRAGREGGLARVNNVLKYLPYNRLFKEAETIEAAGEYFDGYLNRNSLRYIPLYGLDDTATFVRGTLRYPGFCRLWHLLVAAGVTADHIPLPVEKPVAYKDYMKVFLPDAHAAARNQFSEMAGIPVSDHDWDAIRWMLETGQLMDLPMATPAEALQKLLEEKWQMQPTDRDRVVMIHEFEFSSKGESFIHKSWMDLSGEDIHRTAMAHTVGMPLALAAALIADGGLKRAGVLMPTLPEIYEPILEGLARQNIVFRNETQPL